MRFPWQKPDDVELTRMFCERFEISSVHLADLISQKICRAPLVAPPNEPAGDYAKENAEAIGCNQTWLTPICELWENEAKEARLSSNNPQRATDAESIATTANLLRSKIIAFYSTWRLRP